MKNVNPDSLRLTDILQAISDIEMMGFKQNSPRRDLLAICYSIAIIGEAAGKLSIELRAKYASIPWRDIIAMRHKIVHDYGKIDISVVQAVVDDEIPLLKQNIIAIQSQIEGRT